jgi:hypothetical protein
MNRFVALKLTYYYLRKFVVKNILYVVCIYTVLYSVSSMATNLGISCSGQAEYNQFKISKLTINNKKIVITYSKKDLGVVTKEYITTEFLVPNGGLTDTGGKTVFIGGTKSGRKDDYDDISLPHYGVYKSGLGSEIAFNHGAERIFGTVNCNQ